MVPFRFVNDNTTDPLTVETPLSGSLLLDFPLLNKGSSFSEEERRAFGLEGLVPPHVSSWEEQLDRVYANFVGKESDLEKYVFLISLQDRNEVLFYGLLHRHITEMMPIIYTPVVGAASQNYSRLYRRPRGLYLSYKNRDRLDAMLANAPSETKVIVVTDGERILGLGDLGMNGMGIPVGKLSLYTLCAGLHPATTLPIILDVGTDNEELQKDRLYLGCHHPRVRGADYDAFVEAFVSAVLRRFPDALLQWEDFSKNNAPRLLERYRDRLCSFNDDIQGTGAVTLAGLLSASRALGRTLGEQTIVILGAGSAATGIGDQIAAEMQREGLSAEAVRSRLWLVDSQGLVHDGRAGVEPSKKRFSQPAARVAGWSGSSRIPLAEVVRRLHPTVLIGSAAQPGIFTEALVRDMAAHTDRPIIFPLSNPTSKCEADPADLVRWTEGRAVIATGSPFPAVPWQGRKIVIGQCNNAYIFPGVGLGVVAARARRVTDAMFVAAAGALAEWSAGLRDLDVSLFPPLEKIREVSRHVALAVAREAQRQGHADPATPDELERRVAAHMWTPHYPRLRRMKETG